MLNYIANCFLHFGWAVWGETCDTCTSATFNRLALFFQRFDSAAYEKWRRAGGTVVGDEIVIGSVRFSIGNFFTTIATEMDDRLDSVDI
tara:strand:- start:2365 stop:2631 length:267 start_codon:yes stop_codon:yes gene_type:complete